MSYVFLIEQMTMTIRLLATGCFVHAQVKVEHPVNVKVGSQWGLMVTALALNQCDQILISVFGMLKVLITN